MVIFIMKYEITDKGPKLLTKIINITENSRKGLAPL
jgi:predicted transcriptional regulator